MYPFWYCEYPNKIDGSALFASLFLSLFKEDIKHKHPNTFNNSYESLSPYNFSCGVILFKGMRGIVFMVCAAHNTT